MKIAMAEIKASSRAFAPNNGVKCPTLCPRRFGIFLVGELEGI
jgi:hypothetical protein